MTLEVVYRDNHPTDWIPVKRIFHDEVAYKATIVIGSLGGSGAVFLFFPWRHDGVPSGDNYIDVTNFQREDTNHGVRLTGTVKCIDNSEANIIVHP